MDQVARTCQRPELSARSSGNWLQSLPQAKNEFKPRPKAFHNSMSQVSRSLPWVFLVVLCFMAAIYPADGISWHAVPVKHTNAKNGSAVTLNWHYEMEKNETFLSSWIYFFVDSKPLPFTIASRDGRDNTYHYIYPWENSSLFSIAGKNDVILIVDSAAIKQKYVTFCCEVAWRATDGSKQKKTYCSKIFVYAVPQIIHLNPQLFCKQGDSIKLHCNTTGIPSPHVEWNHDDTLQRIGSSSHILLNITGKRSGGRYCCDADNGFGRDTACTTVNVTEYKPVNTKLSLKYTNILDVNMIRIKCEADASPPANRFIMKINDTEYNSSDGLYTIKVPAARKDKRGQIAVSCIPFNKYGQGPIKKLVFPVYVRSKSPEITNPYKQVILVKEGKDVRLVCNASGYPVPNITWTMYGIVIGVGRIFNITRVKRNDSSCYTCTADNGIGHAKNASICLDVQCLNGTPPPPLKPGIIAAIICACIFVGVVIVVVAVCLWRTRIKASKVKNMDDTIYQEPIDAVDLESEGPLYLARSTSTNDHDDYATVEEYGVPTSLSHVKTNKHSAGEEPLFEPLVTSAL